MATLRRPLIPPWQTSDPCPCGSGHRFDACCLAGAELRVRLPRLLPPPPITGYAHPRCYLHSTNDCSTKISREHFISKTVLEAMQGAIEFGGLPWIAPETTVTYGINSLASNILCKRHNEALSPLDAEAGRIFRSLQDICLNLSPKTKSLSRKGRWFLVSGQALELWGLKTLFGVFHAKLASRQSELLIETHTLDPAPFLAMLESHSLPSRCGLYLRATQGGVISGIDEKVTVVPIGDEQKKALVGIRIGMMGFEFDVLMQPGEIDFAALAREAVYHPWQLLFKNRMRQHMVAMTWADPTSAATVVEFATYRDPHRPAGPVQ